MMWKYRFPYEKIKYGDNIIIYGAGAIGRQYVDQIKNLNYANIVAVVDRSWEQFESDEISLIGLEDLKKKSFDNIIIAIKNDDVRNDIAAQLNHMYYIPEWKIVSEAPTVWEDDDCVNIRHKALSESACFSTDISLAILLGKGLGDAIIAKRFICELIKESDYELLVDIYVDRGICDYIKMLFSDEKCINKVYPNNDIPFDTVCSHYDLAMYPSYILYVYHAELNTINNKNPVFGQKIKRLLKVVSDYQLDNQHNIDNSVVFSRCKKLGLNAYTSYGFGGLFSIKDTRVNIPLCNAFKNRVEELNLPSKFVTINYGWGANDHENEKGYIPNKVWPIERYEEFLKLFNISYPDISVVQLGINDSYKIDGVNQYIFGENIETVKYILRASLLHIDCEGGLVHIATQLGTKCAVLFGPTPVHYFGYPQNINIVSNVCSDCYYLDNDFSICYRRLDKPECMWGITAEEVMEAIAGELNANATMESIL